MSTTQPTALSHPYTTVNLLPASSRQQVKRSWNDSFLSSGQPAEEENGQPLKIPNTASSSSSDDSETSDRTDILDGDKDLKVKRKEQNRIAQQSFRQRKERYVRDLELKIKQVQDNHAYATQQLFQENHQLRAIIYQLESENTALKGVLPVTLDNNPDHLFASIPQAGLGAPITDSAPNPTPNPTYPKPIAAKPLVPILPQQPMIATQPASHLPKKPTNDEEPRPIRQPKETPQPTHQQKEKQKPTQKQKRQSQQQEEKQQPSQQFTFSISTPDSLRFDTLNKNQVDSIELIPLYHPNHDPHAVPRSDNLAPTTTMNSPPEIIAANDDSINTPKTACVSFLDGYDAFERLYDNPSFFDDYGLILPNSRRSSLQSDPEQDTLNKKVGGAGSSSGSHAHRPSRPQPVPDMPLQEDEKYPIWEKITEHAQNNKFSVDHLVEAVRHTTASKRKNKLLVDEWELEAMVNDLNYYL